MFWLSHLINENKLLDDKTTTNTKNILSQIYNDPLTLFNEITLDWKKPITLVEGPVEIFNAGDNSTCILGSSLNENYILFQNQIYLSQ